MLTDQDVKEHKENALRAARVVFFIVMSIGAGLFLASVPFLCGGCGTLAKPEHAVLPMPASGADAWLDPATEIATSFWYGHDIGFAIDNPGGVYVRVTELSTDRVGEYDTWTHEVRLDPYLADKIPEAGCVIAHELGHCLGMEHTEPGQGTSLMSEVVATDANGECYWSSLDQDELIRVGHARGIRCP